MSQPASPLEPLTYCSATIFVLYGLNPALSGITAALVRSVTFWSPLIIGYVIVQVVGAKKLLAPPPKRKNNPAENSQHTKMTLLL